MTDVLLTLGIILFGTLRNKSSFSFHIPETNLTTSKITEAGKKREKSGKNMGILIFPVLDRYGKKAGKDKSA